MQTYNELWNDYDFVFKRVDEQHNYIVSIEKSDRPRKRKDELIADADFIYERFLKQQRKLMSDPQSFFLRKKPIPEPYVKRDF